MTEIISETQIIQITANILVLAIGTQISLKLSPQYSIIYASVIHHLETYDTTVLKGFFNRNSKDFQQLDIQTTLERYNCKLFFNRCLKKRRGAEAQRKHNLKTIYFLFF